MALFIGSKRIMTRGRGSQEVWHLAANSVMEYARFEQRLKSGMITARIERNGSVREQSLAYVAGLLHHTVSYPHKAVDLTLHSWEYAGKSQVVPMLPCTLEPTLPYLPIVRLPQAYVDVAVQYLKMEYFLYAHDMEAAASALRTPKMPAEPDYEWCSHPKEVTQARIGYAAQLEAYYHQLSLVSSWQDPRRPEKNTIVKHYEPLIRSAIVRLLASGEWIDSPETTFDPASDEADAVLRLNSKMRAHPMGRNSHLAFSSNPGKVVWTGSKPPLRTYDQ